MCSLQLHMIDTAAHQSSESTPPPPPLPDLDRSIPGLNLAWFPVDLACSCSYGGKFYESNRGPTIIINAHWSKYIRSLKWSYPYNEMTE